jgi:hypothetical protein
LPGHHGRLTTATKIRNLSQIHESLSELNIVKFKKYAFLNAYEINGVIGEATAVYKCVLVRSEKRVSRTKLNVFVFIKNWTLMGHTQKFQRLTRFFL